MLVLLLFVSITLSDQITKYLVWSNFALGERVPIIEGFFDLTYVANTGAAWGIFQNQTAWLAALSIVVFFAILVFRRSFLRDTLAHRICMGLMLGGIMGNGLDRLRLGHVIDFFDFYVGASHFPAFNIADAAICVGVGLYLLTELPHAKAEAHAKDSGGPAA